MAHVRLYSSLAACYDAVMDHVDYEEWVAYIVDILTWYDHRPESVLELGCGTATFAHLFTEGVKTGYLATDGSEDMLEVARGKYPETDVEFIKLDFKTLDFESEFDTVLLLYDGLNYLLHEEEILDLFVRVHRALKPGGLFIFDQSTPLNSINNQGFFEDEGASGSVKYIRKSSYDEEKGIHTTAFEISNESGSFEEVHTQRCYTGAEIQTIIEKTSFEIEGAFDGFSLETADNDSERIHWVVRKS